MEIRKIKRLMELVLLSIFWLLGLYDPDRPVTLLFQNSLYMFLTSQQITHHRLCTRFQASDCLGATMVEVGYISVPEIGSFQSRRHMGAARGGAFAEKKSILVPTVWLWLAYRSSMLRCVQNPLHVPLVLPQRLDELPRANLSGSAGMHRKSPQH